VVLDAELNVLVVEDGLEVELDGSEDDADSVLLILEIVLLLLNEDVVAKLLDVTEVPKLLEDVVPELVLLVLLNVKVVEGTRVAEEVLKLLINKDEDEIVSELLEGDGRCSLKIRMIQRCSTKHWMMASSQYYSTTRSSRL
jgi:hypothetical protein